MNAPERQAPFNGDGKIHVAQFDNDRLAHWQPTQGPCAEPVLVEDLS